MKKHEIYTGKVTELRFPNKGMVEVDGEEVKVLVKNTLPGEKVEFILTKNREKKKEGLLRGVIQKAEIETEIPPCPHFEECGGCAYQTLSYEGQKQLKLEQVQALFADICLDFPLVSCESSPEPWQYRNKMEFSFGDMEKGGKLTLGLHKLSLIHI